MISAIKVFRSTTVVPYDNIAMETFLTMHVQEGECILYLWQNQDTVVIGRNQNAWEECRVQRFRENRGHLARRLSGGGAVYHDLGNLNFTFASRRADHDPARQSEVILRAVRKLGIPAERTGRNDMEAGGRKFSGNAFYEHRGCCCHHGTLMVHVNLDRMEEALTVSVAKLRSRGVQSVRARVVNLRSFRPDLEIETLEACLTEAFGEVYGLKPEKLDSARLDGTEISLESARMASEEWILGRRIPFSAVMEERFPWGGVRLELTVRDGKVEEALCWSDAMNEQIIPAFGQALTGCPYDGEMLARRILDKTACLDPGMAAGVSRMILNQTDGADP